MPTMSIKTGVPTLNIIRADGRKFQLVTTGGVRFSYHYTRDSRPNMFLGVRLLKTQRVDIEGLENEIFQIQVIEPPDVFGHFNVRVISGCRLFIKSSTWARTESTQDVLHVKFDREIMIQGQDRHLTDLGAADWLQSLRTWLWQMFSPAA